MNRNEIKRDIHDLHRALYAATLAAVIVTVVYWWPL